ncbi:MAG: hypothetical protein CME62_14215 [Halobacteriovoraceae bacterium]|nr:hypothetical protein [Halobacteriovoraceae bacterium]|tara:strand:+ start:21279 stop:22058 length:780 start_codon:yes stop_codon:yes gene_type:complete
MSTISNTHSQTAMQETSKPKVDAKSLTNSNEKTSEKKSSSQKSAHKVELSEKALELKKELEAKKLEESKKESMIEKAHKIHAKKFGELAKPGVYFISGFDWFGAGSIKGNYDGIKDMSEAIDGAKHYSWDQQEEIIADIKKRSPDQPIALIGHSFGGDSAMEVAQELNTIENGFRKIDLLITLDAVGADNDKVPQNVKRNINFLAQGPWNFLNDGPNIALDYARTEVENYLRSEEHAALDDTTDIQIKVLEEVDKVLKA